MLESLQNSSFFVPYSEIKSANCCGESFEFSGQTFGRGFIGDKDNILVKYLSNPESIKCSDWPLVLFGVAGTGKTALGVSVTAKLGQLKSQRTITLTADGFRRKFNAALDTNSLTEFRNLFKFSAAVFIDDIQRLTQYLAAQNELVGLLDILKNQEVPVIFTTSDTEILSLDPRLISRITSGLCLQVNRPGFIARKTMFRQSASLTNLEIDDDTVEYLASTFVVTYPKIMSFFHWFTIWVRSSRGDSPAVIDLPLVLEFLSSSNKSDASTTENILSLVASSFKLKVRDLKSSSRQQTVVLARGVCVYLLRTLLKMSYSNIGQAIGGRDHSTIMHALSRIQKNINSDLELEKSVETIKQNVLEHCFLNMELTCEQPVN